MHKHNFEFGNICRKCKKCFCETCNDRRYKDLNLRTIEYKEPNYNVINLLFPCDMSDEDYIIKNIIE
jgi:hypothetical protein